MKCIPKINLSNLKLSKVLRTHNDIVSSICLLADGRLASSSFDGTIKIHNLLTYDCEIAIGAHANFVMFVTEINDGCLASCSEDGTVKIWKLSLQSYTLIKTLKGHDDAVFKVIKLSGNRIASCSGDGTIRIWLNDYSFEHLITLNSHNESIISIIELKNESYIFSVGNNEDNTLRLWNSSTYKCEKVIENVECQWCNGLLEVNTKVLVGGKEGLYIIDVNTQQLESKIKMENVRNINSMISFEDNKVLVGCNEGKLFYLNCEDCKILSLKEAAHNSDIYGLVYLEDGKLITCSENLIKIWEKGKYQDSFY